MEYHNSNWEIIRTNEFIDLEKTFFSGQIFSFTKVCKNTDNYSENTLDIEMQDISNYIEVSDETAKINYRKHKSKKKNTKFINTLTTKTNHIQYEDVFIGHLDKHEFILKQSTNGILYKTKHPTPDDVLINFFTLDINYAELISTFNHPQIKYNGLRLLRVDPIECLMSFICSSMNNIKRISKMVLFLKKITYNFDLSILNDNAINEEIFRNNGFGYRSKYIYNSLIKLKEMNIVDFKDKQTLEKILLSFPGVGRKVCDCVLLMGYSFFDVVPIDVHMFRVSKRIFNLECKNINATVYRDLQKLYNERFGKYCGIAQLYLFKLSIDKKRP